MRAYAENTRIAIIGAGPSGLAAAEALVEQGYTNITLFEKRDRAGGMSLTRHFRTPDGRNLPYELGSVQPVGSRRLFRLMKKYGINLGKKNLGRHQNPNKVIHAKLHSLETHQPIIDFLRYKLGVPVWKFARQLPEFLRLGWLLFKYRGLTKPGYGDLDEKTLRELALPLQDWLVLKKFTRIKDILEILGSPTTAMRQDLRKTVPAIIEFKILYHMLTLPHRYIDGSAKFVREGYQEIWNRVAADKNVRYGAQISSITRSVHGISIDVDGSSERFDKLILSCSPRQTLGFLDTSNEEAEVLGKTRFAETWRVVFSGKNLPHDGMYTIAEPYFSDRYTRPTIPFFYVEGQIDDQTWLYSGLINLATQDGLEEAMATAKEMLEKEFGGTVLEWLDWCYWPEYTPHFSTADTAGGVYRRFERLQGRLNTFHVGGAIAGSLHTIVTDYSFDLVKKYF